MNDWEPPQLGDAAQIPVTPVASPVRWWKRKAGRLPVWAWIGIGAVVVGGLAELGAPADEPNLASTVSRPTTTDACPAASDPTSAVPSTDAPDPEPSTTAVPTTLEPTTTTTTVPPTTTTTTVPPTTTTTTTPPTTTTTTPTRVAPPLPSTTVAVHPLLPPTGCDPNYTGCVPIDTDVDCAGGSGNGPSYAEGPVQVIGTDIYDLDGDGIGCE